MSLRWVHAVLILLSAMLAVVFGAWSLSVYGREDAISYLVAALVAFALSFGLIAYDSWFLRKTRSFR